MFEFESQDEFEAYARACLYEKIDDKTFNFIMSDWGLELIGKSPFLTTKEFAERFQISRERQKNYRSRAIDPLRYRQEADCDRCSIIYETSVVLKWLERHFPDALI